MSMTVCEGDAQGNRQLSHRVLKGLHHRRRRDCGHLGKGFWEMKQRNGLGDSGFRARGLHQVRSSECVFWEQE